MIMEHFAFTLKPFGMLAGDSPDGIVKYNCYGTGVVKIKCLYSCKDVPFELRVEE